MFGTDDLCFLDTNVLLYSVSVSADEAGKQVVAEHLLRRANNALSVQVLQEFYVQATRPGRLGALRHQEAAGLAQAWRRFPVLDTTLGVFNAALVIREAHRFSYWDCAILASAAALGCRFLLTEDMQHGRVVEGVRIFDPFR